MIRLKKIISVILIATFISVSIPESLFLQETVTASAATPTVQAKAYVVMDANSGKIFYKKNMNKRIYPASTVKLMTAIVALENASLSDNIKFTKAIRKKVPSDASKLWLKSGTSYTVNQYLHMMLISSDADSAMALACGTTGSYNKFISLMNKKAESYGMYDTSFDNPIGLDKGSGYNKTYASAYDFTILARRAMSYGAIRSIVAKSKYRVSARKGKPTFTIESTNQFYSTYKIKEKTYEIIGSKTGTTHAAGRVLIATARDEEGHELVCAYFGGNTSEQLYGGIKKLLNYTFNQYYKDNINLTLGFWDTRYRKSESTIRKYASSYAIAMTDTGRFNPKSIKSASFTIDMMNEISGMAMIADDNNSLTVASLAMAYYDACMKMGNEYIGVATDSAVAITGSIAASSYETLTDYEFNILNTLEGTEVFDLSEQKKIAYLYSSKVMNSTGITDVSHELSKEEAVLIADKLSL